MLDISSKTLIWEGNFSKIYLCYDKSRRKNVVLKFFPKDYRELAEREYAFLSKIKFMLPEVYEFFEDDDGIYIVREYLAGKTLREIMEENGKIPDDIALFICLEVLRFLDFIQDKDEYNGDITPSNILITYDGQIRILDCAKSEDIRTPKYYPVGNLKSIQADIMAVGKILDEMTDNPQIKRLAKKAYEGHFKTPKDFIFEIYRIIPKFGIALEREVSSFIIGKYQSGEKGTSRHAKFEYIILPIAISTFVVFLLYNRNGFKQNFAFLKSEKQNQFHEQSLQSSEKKQLSEENQSDTPEMKQEEVNQRFSHSVTGIGEKVTTQERGNGGEEKRIKRSIDQKRADKKMVRKKSFLYRKSKVSNPVIGRTEKGYISVNSIPPDCDIYINGRFIDKTPVIKFEVSAGELKLSLRCGEKEKDLDVKVYDGSYVIVFADLKNDSVEIKYSSSEN